MTDKQAKAIALKRVVEWAIESCDDICDECGGVGFVLTGNMPAPTNNGSWESWQPCASCGGNGINQMLHDMYDTVSG